MNKALLSILVILFYLPFPLYAQGSSTAVSKEIINKIIKSYGGEQNILSVTAYRLEADITAHARKKNGTVIRVSEGLSQLKVLIDYTTDMESACRKAQYVTETVPEIIEVKKQIFQQADQ